MRRKIEMLEAHAVETQLLADEAWINYAREAVRAGVRCDVEPRALKALSWIVEVSPGVCVLRSEP